MAGNPRMQKDRKPCLLSKSKWTSRKGRTNGQEGNEMLEPHNESQFPFIQDESSNDAPKYIKRTI